MRRAAGVRFGLRGRGEGIDQLVYRLGAAHPWLGTDRAHPIGEARYEAEILQHMLFADQPHGHDAAGRDGDGGAERPLQFEYALRMLSGQSIRLFWKTSCRHWGFPEWHR